VVQVAIRRSRQLARPETDVVQGLIVNAKNLIGGLNELVNGQSAVAGLDNGLRYLRGRDNGIRRGNAIRRLFLELAKQKNPKPGARPALERAHQLEALKGVT
jgi:hypothetical protein